MASACACKPHAPPRRGGYVRSGAAAAGACRARASVPMMWCSSTNWAVSMGHQTISPSQAPSSPWRFRTGARPRSSGPDRHRAIRSLLERAVRASPVPDDMEVRNARARESRARSSLSPPALLALRSCQAPRRSHQRRTTSARTMSVPVRREGSCRYEEAASPWRPHGPRSSQNARPSRAVERSSQESMRVVRSRYAESVRQPR